MKFVPDLFLRSFPGVCLPFPIKLIFHSEAADEEMNPLAESRIYEKNEAGSKPVMMLNLHVQNKMLSFYHREETILFIDLVSKIHH